MEILPKGGDIISTAKQTSPQNTFKNVLKCSKLEVVEMSEIFSDLIGSVFMLVEGYSQASISSLEQVRDLRSLD